MFPKEKCALDSSESKAHFELVEEGVHRLNFLRQKSWVGTSVQFAWCDRKGYDFVSYASDRICLIGSNEALFATACCGNELRHSGFR